MDMTVTPAAGKFIRRMLRLGGAPGCGFRLIMTAAGCSGLAGEFSVEAKPRPGDAVLERDGWKLFLPAGSRLLLAGVTMDFADTPTQTGLVFQDPKASNCGCSTPESSATAPAMAKVPVSSIVRRA